MRDEIKGCKCAQTEAEDKVRELQEWLEEQSTSSLQYPENLEKEMQYHLSQCIAGQLHDTKLVMEAQIRDELEAEYATQQEDKSRSIFKLDNMLHRQLAQTKSNQEDLLMKVRDSQQ